MICFSGLGVGGYKMSLFLFYVTFSCSKENKFRSLVTKQAYSKGEIPVGVVIVARQQVIARSQTVHLATQIFFS